MTHKHLEEVDLSTLSPTELRERLAWRDRQQPEVVRHQRQLEGRQRLDEKLQDAREGYLNAGGGLKDWPAHERQLRDELVRDEAKAAAEAAHAEAWRQTKSNF